MKLLMLVCLFVVFAANQTFAVKITSNGLQRVTKGEECTFRWTVDESITSYVIYNRTTGRSTTLRHNSYQDYDNSSGVITLVVSNVQLTDAGNYSLEIKKGSKTAIDSTACLFVYGSLRGAVVLTLGSNPATEGDTVELTCNLTSTSMPVTSRPKIHYTWKISQIKRFKFISSGPVMLWNGDVVAGYSVKNNGRTLRISSIRAWYDRFVTCFGVEEGSDVKLLDDNLAIKNFELRSFLSKQEIYEHCEDDSIPKCYNYGINRIFRLRMNFRPYILVDPEVESRKLNAAVGKQVKLLIWTDDNPDITSVTNWTLVNPAGVSRTFPVPAVRSSNGIYLAFRLTSTAYYGNVSITLTNEIGSTTLTFQVLPEGPPEAPSNVRIKYVSHSQIAIQWNVMHSNSDEHSQRVYLRLKLSEDGSTAESSGVTYLSETYNFIIYSYIFTKNIQPETNYKVSVWSVNGFGSSEVVELEVRTRKQPKLQVSPETISIEGTRAIIDFTVELGDEDADEVVRVEAQCCSLFSGQCSNYSGKYNGSQVAVDNIPDGTVHFFDLIIYSGIHNKYYYYSNAVRGIRVPRDRNEDRNPDSHLAAVPILAFLDQQQCAGISDSTEERPPPD